MTAALTAPTPAETALAQITLVQGLAARASVALRAPPPLPTTYCGRGCNGCAWEGYFDAVTWWLEDAVEALRNQGASAGSTG